MKKLLIIAALMLATVVSVASCDTTDDPAVTTDGETTAKVEEVTTAEPEDDTTVAPETEPETDPETEPETTVEPETEAPAPEYPQLDNVVAFLPLEHKVGNKVENGLVSAKGGNLGYAAGYVGGGANLSTGYVTMKNWKPDGNSFSVSMWVNTNVTGGDASLVGNKDWGSGGNPGFVFTLENDRIRLNVADGNGNRQDPGFGYDTSLKQTWMYVTMVVDREAQQVKVSYNFNTFQVWNIPDSLKGFNFNSPFEVLNIGNDGTGNYSLLGDTRVDDVMIFDGVLTELDLQEIARFYGEDDMLVANKGVAAYLPLEHKVGNQLKGEGVLESVKGGTLGYAAGYIGGGANLSSGYITMKNWKPDGNSFSVSMWVNTNVTGGDSVLVGNKDWGSGGNPGFLFSLENDRIRFNIADGNGNRRDPGFNYDTSLKQTWMYVTMVVDREAQQVKVSFNFDDFLVWNIPDALKGYDFNSPFEVMNIGNDGTGNYGLLSDTRVDDVLVYNTALSNADLKLIAAYYGVEAPTHVYKDVSTNKTYYVEGETVRVNAAGDSNDRVYIYNDKGEFISRWQAANGEIKLSAGKYTIRLMAGDRGFGDTEWTIDETTIYVYPSNALYTEDVVDGEKKSMKTVYEIGELVNISAMYYTDTDWIGIAKYGENYSEWAYVKDIAFDEETGKIDLQTLFQTEGENGITKYELPAGKYTLRLVANNAGWNDNVVKEINFIVYDVTKPVTVITADQFGTGGMNGIASAEVKTDAACFKYMHIVPNGTDPYFTAFNNVLGGRYVAIRYKTNATGGKVQFFMGTTGGPSGPDNIATPAIADEKWNTMVVDLKPLIDSGHFDGYNVGYFRFDALEGLQSVENLYIDVEYIAFFHDADLAASYLPNVDYVRAEGVKAEANSVENDTNVVANAIDGKSDTRWGAKEKGPADLIVDLNAVRTIEQLRVSFENASHKHTISYSVDGTNYTTLKVDDAHGSAVKTFDLEQPTEMRYIKFTRNAAEGEGSWFSIWEVNAMGARG